MKINKYEAKEVITAKINDWVHKGYAVSGYQHPDRLLDIIWGGQDPYILTQLIINETNIRISDLRKGWKGINCSMSAVSIDEPVEDFSASVTKQQAKKIIERKIKEWKNQGLAIAGYDEPESLVNKAWYQEDPSSLKLLKVDNKESKLALLLCDDGDTSAYAWMFGIQANIISNHFDAWVTKEIAYKLINDKVKEWNSKGFKLKTEINPSSLVRVVWKFNTEDTLTRLLITEEQIEIYATWSPCHSTKIKALNTSKTA